MPRYLTSLDDGSMTLPAEDLPAAADAAHAVPREAKAAGVWVHGGGLERQRAGIVATAGTVVDGPSPETKAVIGGFSIIDVPTRAEALAWAAKIAAACRCAQEVRALTDDPEVWPRRERRGDLMRTALRLRMVRIGLRPQPCGRRRFVRRGAAKRSRRTDHVPHGSRLGPTGAARARPHVGHGAQARDLDEQRTTGFRCLGAHPHR